MRHDLGMSDVNKKLQNIHNRFSSLKKELMALTVDYDAVYKEVNRDYIEEKNASGNTKELSDFFYMVQTLRRNKDVLASLLRGSTGMRSTEHFRYIETKSTSVKQEKRKRTSQKSLEVPLTESDDFLIDEGILS